MKLIIEGKLDIMNKDNDSGFMKLEFAI